MCDKINKLKIDRTIKEYDYLKSEYDYINVVSDDADQEFMNIVNNYLNDKPVLKEIYESKETKIVEENFNKVKSKIKEITDSVNDEEIKEIEKLPKKKSKKSRTLYREIAKQTHPDKVYDEKLQELYIKATNSYNEDDAVSLYAICRELGISFGVNEDDLVFFEENIHRIKGEINLLKGTYAYRWSQAENNEKRNNILLEFINIKIR